MRSPFRLGKLSANDTLPPACAKDPEACKSEDVSLLSMAADGGQNARLFDGPATRPGPCEASVPVARSKLRSGLK